MRKPLAVIAVCALAGLVPAVAPAQPSAAKPVPTLQPQATQRLWRTLVSRAHTARRPSASRDCRPARVIFYTDTDWLRLATKLAAAASPCAQYYISIPPLAADKTTFRRDQGWRIDALGPQFHALAEINYTGWSKWVAAGNGSWYDAGVQARRNMARDNYDIGRGDGWAMNEISSAVRRNGGSSRQSLRDFLRGLSTGDGGPAVKGTVFVIGVDQGSPDLSAYKDNLQGWFQDAAFWSDLSAYTTDFAQEAYGDVHAYAAPGTTPQQRRDELEQYLEHPLVLADAGPQDGTVDAARGYLQQAYSPLANAAWTWTSGFGWTNVPYDLMEQYVSAQTYAMRAFAATTGSPLDRLGYAWAPRSNGTLSSSDFAAETGAIEDRLAAAIRDSGETADPSDPGAGACGAPGAPTWCGGDLAGAALTPAWQTFAQWPYPATAVAGTPATLTAGAASGPLTVQLQGGGAPQTALADTPVTLATSSPRGGFATSPAGPWAPTLTLTVPAGGTASGAFYYHDTRAGAATLTATASGRTGATQPLRVVAAAPARLTLAPRSSLLRRGASRLFRVTAVDAFGNPATAAVRWSISRSAPGRLRRVSATAARFTARRRGSATLRAAMSGGLAATARVTVR